MKPTLRHDKNIFTSYVGLTAGGYTLAETKENKELIRKIRGIAWDKDIINYFSEAKTNTCEVNPYYPRAFFLTIASLYIVIKDKVFYNKLDELCRYIGDMEVNPDEKDDNCIKWIEQMPYYFEKVLNTEGFEDLWSYYLSYVSRYDSVYEKILDNAILKIAKAFKTDEDDLSQITVIPNRLQAPQATDIVCKDDIIYIIKPEPDEESIIHEYLHSVFDKYLHENKALVNQYLYLLKPVMNDMLKYQYAWDYGTDSWSRVFEESFMRAVSIWVCNYDDIEIAVSKACYYASDGFIYIPAILKCFICKWTSLNNFNQFLKICLAECDRNINISDKEKINNGK